MTTIQNPAAEFSRSVSGYANPVRRNLIGEFIIGGTADLSRRNLVNRAKPGIVVGTPTFQANYGSFNNQSNRIETGVSCTMKDQTLVLLARSTAGFGEALINSDGAVNAIVLTHTVKDWQYTNSRGANPPVAAQVTVTGTGFRVGIAYGRQGDFPALAVGSGGIGFSSNVGTGAGQTRAVTGQFLIAGTRGVGALQCDIAYAAIYDRRLTSREMLLIYKGLYAAYSPLIEVL